MAALKLAVIGATPTFLELLAASGLQVAALYPLAAQDDGSLLEHGEAAWPVLALDEFDWADADQLLCLADAELSARAITAALAAGKLVLDSSAAGVEAPAGGAGRLINLPHSISLLLARPLQALQAAGLLQSSMASVLLPASHAGQLGVDELSAQVRALFGQTDLVQSVFARRLAFNLLPESSASLHEALIRQLERLVPGGVPASIVLQLVPLFYGMQATLALQFTREVDEAGLRAALAANDGLYLVPAGQLVSTQEVIGGDKVWVTQVSLAADGRSAQVQMLADNARLQALAVLAGLLQLQTRH